MVEREQKGCNWCFVLKNKNQKKAEGAGMQSILHDESTLGTLCQV